MYTASKFKGSDDMMGKHSFIAFFFIVLGVLDGQSSRLLGHIDETYPPIASEKRLSENCLKKINFKNKICIFLGVINLTSMNCLYSNMERVLGFSLLKKNDLEVYDENFSSNDTGAHGDLDELLLVNLKQKWQGLNIDFSPNANMPHEFESQLNLSKYLPLKSSHLTDDTGMVGMGYIGIAYLALNKEEGILEVAKFMRTDLNHQKVREKAMKHLLYEQKNSKDWAMFSQDLNVRNENGVVFKRFIYGKPLRFWLKTESLFQESEDPDNKREKLIELFQKMIRSHKLISDLQSENLIFSEWDKEWVIIDGYSAIDYLTVNATLEKFANVAEKKFSFHLNITNEHELQVFNKKIAKLVSDILAI